MKYRNILDETCSNLPDSVTVTLISALTATYELVFKMRQKPKLHEKKLTPGLKSRHSVLSDANVGTTKRKRPKTRYSRLARCRLKFNGHVVQPQKKRRKLPDQTAPMAKGMAGLHLPFLTSAESSSLSTAE